MVKIAVMGHGVVGSGVVEVLMTHADSIEKKAKERIEVKRILDLREFPNLPYAQLFTKSFDDIVGDEEIRVVVEVMGGVHPAFEFCKRCLESGKSVVTSNKELVAEKGDELLALAQKNNLNFLFEASVGGGIPIIRPLSQCLAANDFCAIAGILNGTTNFILTKMIQERMSFEQALGLAQRLGYAEKDPTADIEGKDACRKICILASLAYGRHVYPSQVHTEGITAITAEDIDCAASIKSVVKLIGRVKMMPNGKIRIIVAPMVVGKDNPLSGVDDVFNGIMVCGDETGDVMFYGRGAGKLPTASAVVADVIDCVKHFKARKYLFWESAGTDYVEDTEKDAFCYMIRTKCADVYGAKSQISHLFSDISFIWRERALNDEVAFSTQLLDRSQLAQRLQLLHENGIEAVSCIRMADF